MPTQLTLVPAGPGALVVSPSTGDARFAYGTALSWTASHSFADVNKDGLFYIAGFTDASGSASPTTFTKLYGGRATKTGLGNLDAFWASVDHQGAGEAGLFIGDVTADAAGAGGNVWGGDFVLKLDQAVNAWGHRISINPTVDVSSKSQRALEIANENDSFALTQGVRVRGNFTNPLIIYSDAAGTAQLLTVDHSGNLNIKGSLNPTTSGNVDLGAIGSRWRNVYVNNVLINGADAASGSAVLAIHNAAVAPSTTPASGGVAYVSSGIIRWLDSAGTDVALNRATVVSKSANYTVSLADAVVLADASGGAFTVTLPNPSGIVGMRYTIKRINSAANAVTVATAAGLIDGASTVSLAAQWDAITVISDGVNWNIIANRPSSLGL